MLNNDMTHREELRGMMQQAIKDGDTDAFYQSFDQMIEQIGADIKEDYDAQMTQLREEVDANVLAQRGVRQLTSEERKYYNKLSGAMKSNNPRQALTDTDLILPKTIMDAVFDELQTSHPLLSRIEFLNTTAVTEMIMNTNGYQEAAWGKLCDEIIKEIPEVDAFARDVAYTYTKPLEKYKNPRGGMFQAGLYPVSANVPLGGQTGATPDGRLAHMPVADGVSPSAGKDVNGPTAAANSVSRLDHFIASNGTLFNQKFHPSALSGREGLEKFVGLIQSYFDQKGSHMQFNVVSRETLLDAQKHPEQYKHLVVRVAGYSALFTTLSKSLQDDIIRRTEQGF